MLKLATKFLPRRLALETAYSAGFRYAELWLGPAILAEWQTVLELVRSYPNGYVLHFPNSLDLSLEMLEPIVALYRQLGCRCMVIHQPSYDKFREALLRLDPGLRLAVENHILSPDELVDWAEQNSGLTLDVEHLWKYTLRDTSLEKFREEVRVLFGRYGDKLLHIHAPGYFPGSKEHRPMYCSRDMVFPLLSLLAEARFEGFVVSEVDTEYQNVRELQMNAAI
jgi:sugar phosphate isomerase/epimerase